MVVALTIWFLAYCVMRQILGVQMIVGNSRDMGNSRPITVFEAFRHHPSDCPSVPSFSYPGDHPHWPS